MNHDTQEGQTSQTLVSPWFIPLAYALILLHTNGGTPVVFYVRLSIARSGQLDQDVNMSDRATSMAPSVPSAPAQLAHMNPLTTVAA